MEELRVNDICLFDPDNKLNISGEIYTYCRIIRTEGYFLKKYFVVFCDKDGNPYQSNEQEVSPTLLRKLNPSEVVVTRYPYDTPIVKEDEVEAMAKLYSIFLADTTISNKLTETEKITIAKLIAKLQLFSAVIHQY